MKKVFIALLILSANFLSAQYVFRAYDSEDFQKVLKTKKIYVPALGVADYDSALVKSLREHWKFMRYDVISIKQYENLNKDRDNLFLAPFRYDVTDGSTVINLFLGVFFGGNDDMYAIDMIAWAGLDYPDGADYKQMLVASLFKTTYRLPDLIATLSKSLEGHRDNQYKIKKDFYSNIKFYFNEVYNPKMVRLKDKTLYIPKDIFRTVPDIKKVYPYKFKVVDQKEYEKAISNPPSDMVYLFNFYSWWGGLSIFDPNTHENIGGVIIKKTSKVDLGDIGVLVKVLKKVESDK